MSTGDELPYSDLCPARGRQRREVPVLSNEASLQEERFPLAMSRLFFSARPTWYLPTRPLHPRREP